MRVYVASRYQLPINNTVKNRLEEHGIDVFLPKDINVDAQTPEELQQVYQTCFQEIAQSCDVILFIYPFGLSVSAEFGAAAMLKFLGREKKLLLLNLSGEPICKAEKEAMIRPAVDQVFSKLEDVVSYLAKLAE